MNKIRVPALWFALFAAVGLTAGCSKSQSVDSARVSAIALEKVNLIKKLADEVAKNPGSVDVAGLVEEFMNTPLDPKAFPVESAEILKIYEERIKGKLKGETAQQMNSAIAQLKS